MKQSPMLSFKNLALSRNKPVQQSFSKSRLSNFTNQSNHSAIFQDSFNTEYSNFSSIHKITSFDTCCKNHNNKLGEYQVDKFEGIFCKKCAATFASKGIKVIKMQEYMKQNNSIIMNRPLSNNKQNFQLSRRIIPQQKENMRIDLKKNISPLNLNVMKNLNQNKNKNQDKAKKQQIFSQQKLYNQKLQKIHELIDDISIQDLQQFQKYRNSFCISNQQQEEYSLFGRQIKKENMKQENIKATFAKALQKLSNIQEFISKIKNGQNLQTNSINQNYNSLLNTNSYELRQPHSCSSRTKTYDSNKSQQDLKSNMCKKTYQKCKYSQNSENDIQISRLSINDRKNKPLKQNLSVKTQKPKEKDSNKHCEDTPESLKSKINESRLVIPKNMAVTMFQKINICESINLSSNQIVEARNQENIKQEHIFRQNRSQKITKNTEIFEQKNMNDDAKKQTYQSFKSSENSKSRKSFNRYKVVEKEN